VTDVYKTMEEEQLKLEAIAREARVELTPELRVFAWLIKHHALIDFWDSAAKQAKYQHEMLERFLEKEKNSG
jgi:hypothetical protein